MRSLTNLHCEIFLLPIEKTDKMCYNNLYNKLLWKTVSKNNINVGLLWFTEFIRKKRTHMQLKLNQ